MEYSQPRPVGTLQTWPRIAVSTVIMLCASFPGGLAVDAGESLVQWRFDPAEAHLWRALALVSWVASALDSARRSSTSVSRPATGAITF